MQSKERSRQPLSFLFSNHCPGKINFNIRQQGKAGVAWFFYCFPCHCLVCHWVAWTVQEHLRKKDYLGQVHVFMYCVFGLFFWDKLKSHSTLLSSWPVVYGNHNVPTEPMCKEIGPFKQNVTCEETTACLVIRPSVHTALWHWLMMCVFILLLS